LTLLLIDELVTDASRLLRDASETGLQMGCRAIVLAMLLVVADADQRRSRLRILPLIRQS
jgi:hypothetical protein